MVQDLSRCIGFTYILKVQNIQYPALPLQKPPQPSPLTKGKARGAGFMIFCFSPAGGRKRHCPGSDKILFIYSSTWRFPTATFFLRRTGGIPAAQEFFTNAETDAGISAAHLFPSNPLQRQAISSHRRPQTLLAQRLEPVVSWNAI